MAPEWYRLFQSAFGEVTTLTGATGTANTMPGNNTGSAAADVRLTAAQIKTFLGIASGDVSGLGDFATADSFSHVEAISGVIDFPDAKDYRIAINMPFAFTMNTTTTRTTAGTATVVTKKNTTAVTGLSNSASTSEVTTTATAGNTFVAGDDVVLTVSSVSSTCEGLAFTIKITRTVTP
jgi:hypothetical protein